MLTVAIAQATPVLLNRIAMEKQTLDTAGHYFRPDVFTLTVDRRRTGPCDLPAP